MSERANERAKARATGGKAAGWWFSAS